MIAFIIQSVFGASSVFICIAYDFILYRICLFSKYIYDLFSWILKFEKTIPNDSQAGLMQQLQQMPHNFW